jgi:hypothetical protein
MDTDISTEALFWVSALLVAVWLVLRHIVVRQPVKQGPTYLQACSGVVGLGVGGAVGQVIARELLNPDDGNVYGLVVIVCIILGLFWAARISGISWK